MALNDHLELIAAMVRDDAAATSADDRSRALAHAVARYGALRPRRLVKDLQAPADGVLSNRLATDLGAYEADSVVESVEYPVGERPPVLVDSAPYALPTGAIALHADKVPAGRTARITYTTGHVVDATTDTVPPGDREAVAAWAAASLLDQLAARAAGDTDSTISADAVDRDSEADRYRRLAKSCRDRFYELLGLDRMAEMRPGATGAVTAFGRRRLAGGGSRLTDYLYPRVSS